MAEIVYPDDHERVIRERDDAIACAVKAADMWRETAKDRDEWKEQHENLLAIQRSLQAELFKLRRACIEVDRLPLALISRCRICGAKTESLKLAYHTHAVTHRKGCPLRGLNVLPVSENGSHE
jgi:hypothetical protein